jgi:hypothetical protein
VRDEGGPGGFREGVGKTEGLGEADKESDICGGGGDGRAKERELAGSKSNDGGRDRTGMTSPVLLRELSVAPRNRRQLWLPSCA